MRPLPRPGRDAVEAWLVSRAALLALLAFATYLQVRHGLGKPLVRAGETGFYVWDGDWYRTIATRGYVPDEALRFFPLAALPPKLLAPLGAGAVAAALVVFVNVSALAYADGMARLTRFELGDETAARWAPWLTLLNPASYVLFVAYAEATAGALTVWCFLALRRRAWLWAALAAYLFGLSRPIGVILALPALIEAARGVRSARGRELAARALAVAAAPLGTASYLGWVWLTRGDPLLPFSVQQAGDLRDGVLTWPGGLILRTITGTTPFAAEVAVPWIPVVLVGLVLVWRRLPASYTAFTAAILVLALGTPRLASFVRYAFAAFPLIMVAAASRPRSVRLVTLMVCCSGLAGYSVLAFVHRYVP